MKIPAGLRLGHGCSRACHRRRQARYDQVANATGVPWYVIGIIHEMEGGLNFTTHLHNGDP